MVEIRTPIPVETAISRVMKFAKPGSKSYIPIEKSLGHFLAEDLIADHDVPAFDRSPYDGFAIKSEDTEGAAFDQPVELEVVGEIGAGNIYKSTLKPNQTVRIMTGAQIPSGSNAVIMLEHVKELHRNGKKYIQVDKQLQPQENVTPRAEDIRQGEVLVDKGTYINPGIMALLATFGYREVPVSRKPKVGIISTGSELLAVGSPLEPGKIRDSNTYMLIGQIERAGGDPVLLGQFEDDFMLCYNQVVQGLEKVDILLTTGGVSVGDYDHIPAILEKLQAEVLFNKIRMRPGSVTTVASVKGKLLFGLSGNPSSCYVGFELFARPIIRRFLHTESVYARTVTAQLGRSFSRSNPFTRFVRGRLCYKKGKTIAKPVGLDKPNIVTSLAGADVLIQLPGGSVSYEKETEVKVLLLNDQYGSRGWLNADKGANDG